MYERISKLICFFFVILDDLLPEVTAFGLVGNDVTGRLRFLEQRETNAPVTCVGFGCSIRSYGGDLEKVWKVFHFFFYGAQDFPGPASQRARATRK